MIRMRTMSCCQARGSGFYSYEYPDGCLVSRNLGRCGMMRYSIGKDLNHIALKQLFYALERVLLIIRLVATVHHPLSKAVIFISARSLVRLTHFTEASTYGVRLTALVAPLLPFFARHRKRSRTL